MTAHRHRSALVAIAIALAAAAGCADFTETAASFSSQPSLIPAEVSAVPPAPAVPAPASTTGVTTTSPSPAPSSGSTPSSASPPSSTARASSSPSASSSPPPSSTAPGTAVADPCLPPDPAVIGACLASPWGLAPLPDGNSALVGERTTGRILRVVHGHPAVEVAKIPGVVGAGDGGLLGIALSPTYTEDGLIFAYVTTATDNRIIRIAQGDKPRAIFTGIPKGPVDNGGPIAFLGNDLIVATGDAGTAAQARSATSLAGKVLRLSESGQPVGENPGSPIYARGLTHPTGICTLPTGGIGVIDHRGTADLLLGVRAGGDYTTPVSGDALWTYRPVDGGAADCAYSGGTLANTSLSAQRLTGLQLSSQGAFNGAPTVLLDKKYGRLRTVEPGITQPGVGSSFWMTTSNKDGSGRPDAADDRVILLAGGGGGGGADGGTD